jgi:ribonuclease E
MRKSLVISEHDSIAALLENDRVVEFFVNRGELLLGDIYTATVENILPGIDAAFVNLGKDKMGFLHANDVPGQGPLKERLVPKQKLLVQITKEPTGHKGPRVSTAISLPGRFLVLVPEERGVSISRRIAEARERARLKSVVNLLKPPGVGLIIRTEAKGQGEQELFEDFEQLWDRWQSVVSDGEASIGPTLIYRDQDLLYRVIRDAYSTDVNEVIVDSPDGQRRAQEFLSGWTGRNTQVLLHAGEEPVLVAKGIDREIEAALSDRVELPSGGHLNIQPTEALTVIDVNSGRFTSSRTQAETVRRTNLEAAHEIPRQLRLRNIGGMVIVDFIDMESRKDQQLVLEAFQRSLEDDRAKPQIGQLSDLGLVELTRRRQGQSLRELFTTNCQTCSGLGVVPTLEIGFAEHRRLISTKPKEDERGRSQGRRSAASRQQSGLRAASVSSGRVQSTVLGLASPGIRESDEELAEVPQDILEQVPDELLDQRAGAGFGHSGPRGGLPLERDDDSVEADDNDEVAMISQNFSTPRPLFEEDFDDEEDVSVSEALGTSVLEAEKLRLELEIEPAESQSDEISVDEECQVEAPEPYSPFAAEPEPITGVYRLKPKADPVRNDDAEQQASAGSEQALDYSSTLSQAFSSFREGEFDMKTAEQSGLSPAGLVDSPELEHQPVFSSDNGGGSWWNEDRSQQLEIPLASANQNEVDGQGELSVPAALTGGAQPIYNGSVESSFEHGNQDED